MGSAFQKRLYAMEITTVATELMSLPTPQTVQSATKTNFGAQVDGALM